MSDLSIIGLTPVQLSQEEFKKTIEAFQEIAAEIKHYAKQRDEENRIRYDVYGPLGMHFDDYV